MSVFDYSQIIIENSKEKNKQKNRKNVTKHCHNEVLIWSNCFHAVALAKNIAKRLYSIANKYR